MEYMSSTLKLMHEGWEDTLALMDSKLANYTSVRGPNTAVWLTYYQGRNACYTHMYTFYQGHNACRVIHTCIRNTCRYTYVYLGRNACRYTYVYQGCNHLFLCIAVWVFAPLF